MPEKTAIYSSDESSIDASHVSGYYEFSSDIHREEKQLLAQYCRKVDTRILLYSIVLCILNMCDRGSIGVAKVVGLEKDLGLIKNDFNIAATLFTIGYLSLEFFSNFILKRVGASRLLPTLGILWGLVCTLQCVIKTKAQLYIVRVLLGMAECGFTAGILLILSFFYPKENLTSRVGFFYISAPIANTISGPLASALSHIKHQTIKRWQWVFLVEGLATILVSIFGYFILQDHPEKCKFLNEEEKRFIVRYKTREGTLGGSQGLERSEVKKTLKDWQLWVMGITVFSTCNASNIVSIFAPELINELGFSATKSQAMSALPSICGAVTILFAGSFVRLCRSHWLAGAISLSLVVVGSVILVCTLNVPARMFGLCLVGTGGFTGLGVLPGWVISANSKTSSMSTVSSGIAVLFGGSSSFLSSNIFLNWDAPRFLIGHLVNAAMASLGIVCCVIVRISMARRNRRLDEISNEDPDEDGFRYIY